MAENWSLEDYKAGKFHPEYKYTWKKERSVADDYGFNFYDYWKKRKKRILYNREEVIKRFGHPGELDFSLKNIVPFDITPYKNINYIINRKPDPVKEFYVHRMVLPAYRRVFERWNEWGRYPLYGIGSSYSPRYVITDDRKPTYRSRYNANKLQIEAWLEQNRQQIKKSNVLEEVNFEEVAVKLFFYDNAIGIAETNLFSNHSFGLALDVNPLTNALSSKTWDMPPELVRIFGEEGFYWGGFYSEKQLDAMHFEYRLYDVPPATPLIFGPFSGRWGDTPANLYHRSESGDSGIYPIGRNNNLHGGIHLRPVDDGVRQVVTSYPGYIVAARLFSSELYKEEKLASAFCEGYLGLVIVRHVGQPLGESGEPKGEEVVWYSLYLHLSPPRYDIGLGKNDAWNSVPWYRRFLVSRYGTGVVVDPESQLFGRNVWFTEAFSDGKSSIKVIEFGSEGSESSDNKIEVAIRSGDGRKLVVPREAPEDLVEGLDSLQKGALITFHRPFLVVNANEVIGIAGIPEGLKQAEGLAGEFARRGGVEPGFIHWEWLSPPGDNGLEALPKLFDVEQIMPLVEESSNKADNFFEKDELESLFKKHLPEEDQAAFSKVLEKEPYGSKLREFFQKQATSSSNRTNDLDEKTITSPSSVYPITITFNNKYGLKLPENGSYCIEFEFIRRTEKGEEVIGSNTHTVTEKTFKGPITIQVPSGTQLLRVKSKDFHIEEEVATEKVFWDSSLGLFKDLVSHRCRGILLRHLNDWSVDGVIKLIDTLKKKKIVPESLDVEKIKPLAWYNRVSDPEDPFSENPILGPSEGEVSLFSKNASGISEEERKYLLPSDTAIVNMHPVTGNWLVTQLELQRKMRVVSEFDRWEPKESREPYWWSLVYCGGGGVKGNRFYILAIARGFPNDGNAILKLTHNQRTLQYEVPYKGGVALKLIRGLFWGEWRLRVEGATGEPEVDGGVTEISLPPPILCGPVRWQRDYKSGVITLRVFFHKGCPEELESFVHARIRSNDGTEISSGYAVMVCGRRKKEFPYSNRISQELRWVMECCRENWRRHNPSNPTLSLKSIESDGCSATFVFTTEAVATQFTSESQKLFGNEIKFSKNQKEVTVTIPQPEESSGEWECMFNPQELFGNVLQKNEIKKEIDVSFEFISPNGIDVSSYQIKEEDWNVRSINFRISNEKQKYDDEIITTNSIDTQKLKVVKFGSVHSVLREVSGKDGTMLYLDFIQPLEGRIADWKKARPKLTCDFAPEKESKLNGNKLVLSIPFDEKMVGKSPVVKSFIEKNPSKFDGMEIKLPVVESNPLIVPELEFEMPVQDRNIISLTVWGHVIPPGMMCKIMVNKQGGTEEEKEALEKLLVYSAKGSGNWGKFNEGKCTATLRKKGLKKGDVLEFSAVCVDESTEHNVLFNIPLKVKNVQIIVGEVK